MQDITDHLYNYLEASRHLWNTYFRGRIKSLYECSPLEEYEGIEELLFSALVANELDLSCPQSRRDVIDKPWLFIRVRPSAGLNALPMMVSHSVVESVSGNRRWEEAKVIELSDNSDFGFIEFFEWDRYGFVTYPYIRVQIDNRSQLPGLVGKEALIDVINVRIFYEHGRAG